MTIKKSFLALQIVVSLACVAMALALARPAQLWQTLIEARPLYVAIVILLMPVAMLTRSWRWQTILRHNGVRVPLLVMYRISYIGMALNLCLPASSGDIASSYYGWRSQGNKEIMLASATLDKLIGLFTLGLLGCGCGLAIGYYQLAGLSALVTAPIALLLFCPRLVPWHWAAALFRRVFKKELDVDRLVQTFRVDRRLLAACLAISVAGWVVTNGLYYFACQAFASSQTVSLGYVFAVAPLINIMRILPVTVSGLGSADLLILLLLQLVGIPKTSALAVSMLVNVSLIILPGLVGSIFLIQEGLARRAPGPAPSPAAPRPPDEGDTLA